MLLLCASLLSLASCSASLSLPSFKPMKLRKDPEELHIKAGNMVFKSTRVDVQRLRGGGAAQGALPKYPSNRALKQDEYAPPFGTLLRSRSGAFFSPTPTPEWFENGIVYQIYPLGSPGEDGKGGGFFGEVPAENDLTSPPKKRLLELRQWYDHLETLGVTAIYFSPIFESETHGYDTVDYYQIDRRVGDIETFRTIVKELQKRGIKVILDGVFNHTGRKFFAFKDLLKHGADWMKSPYKEWYFISEGNSTYGDPFSYRSWEGHEELPELNVENSEVRDYLFEVGKFWLGEVGIDGWRLDVAHELPPSFWRDFRSACTEANPEHVLLGEVIHGDYNTWVGPAKGLLHSGTNYQLSKALWSSLKDHNFWEIDSAFSRDRMLYREMSLVNFLSNHDVARVATQLENEPQLLPLAYFLLMTVRGIPCIYYGDECGVKGRKEDGDAALRMAMVKPDDEWPAGGRELFNGIAHLVQFRNKHEALKTGSLQTLFHSNNELLFARISDTTGEVLLVAVNSSPEHVHPEVSLGVLSKPPGTPIKCLWGDGADAGAINEEYKARIHIPPYTGRVFTLTPEPMPAETQTTET
ncbi:hypothetical protein GUITHDRAFT_161282 [Guillardia theta CCMP2712]|uniref:Glycosyl hydrolase family 13 catalytic domain-containing protein n=1 Tax=Guillardia theta (strain CCMP2712) TaxID=905079 RepID=L1JWP2_GUITC|nr:hypothetical protein GUITHDRAFT_161282 [Guillardia theta CCMP2712]EKX52762.1 hypothetical protein GUITHDRAFT_161282 [Guillardia theta CCMP2712]|eukprot:XP_005839742.1 hypothetical protein GUITHDRAFT_161282 [Guillardia theta CCMP2712]